MTPLFDGALRIEPRVAYLPEGPETERRVLTLALARPFKAMTLLLWGTKPGDTFLESIVVGHERQTEGRLPAHLFESEIPFEEFQSLLTPREDEHPAVVDMRRVGQHFPIELPTLHTTALLKIEITGPFEHGALLGAMPSDHPKTETGTGALGPSRNDATKQLGEESRPSDLATRAERPTHYRGRP